jgi:RimJ/RimL family protein N-acetyltransferase
MSSSSPTLNPPSPWQSTRLHYHAIRPCDLSVFLAINNDNSGYANSNFTNIKLPGIADAEKFTKGTVEESLLAAIIWLPHPPLAPDTEETQQAREIEWKVRRRPGEVIDPVYGTAIGEIHMSALPLHKTHHRNTEIGLDILHLYQGRGYGSEAINWALDYAFRRAGLHRVQVRGFSYNTGAIRLYERLGFTLEGREREAVYYEGAWWDVVTFGMVEGEWWAKQKVKTDKNSEEFSKKGKVEVLERLKSIERDGKKRERERERERRVEEERERLE